MGNEFVMVPRVPTDEMIVAFAEAWYSKRQAIDDPDMLDAYAAMLAVAPEHQGEPDAWMDPRSPQMHATISNEVKQHNAKFGGAPASAVNGYTIPLYTHADPGEVERLRAEIERLRERVTPTHKSLIGKHAEIIKERDSLRAQLAERDALLDRVIDHATFWHDHPYAEVVEAIAKDYKALSASAEPSAKQEFREHLDKRASEVATWPDWKQEALKRPSTTVERDDRAAELVLDWDVHNKGHGHVFPRADGVRARCGGPRLCSVCAADQVRKDSGVRS